MAEYHRYPYGICFTLNNYTEPMVAAASNAVGQRGINYICWGYEVSSTGTPHLQGYLQSSQKNYQRLKMVFGGGEPSFSIAGAASGPSEAELAGTFGKPYTAIGYCMKGGDFVEFGSAKDIPATKKGQRTDIMEIQEAIDRGQSYDDIVDSHFATASRISRFIKERVQARDSGRQLAALKSQYENSVLRLWQQNLKTLLEGPTDPRKIHWLWESRGNVGKSWMANYLGALMGATILTSGKKVDMAYIYAQKPTPIVVFDLSRVMEAGEGRQHFLDGTYSLAEDLKNGRVVSTKYESKTVFFPSPHVIFFANFPPDLSKWSEDRYDIREL